jgi:hypothetical protein
MINRTERRIALWRDATPEQREQAKRRAAALAPRPDQFRSVCMIELEEMGRDEMRGANAEAGQPDRLTLAAGERV